MSFITGVGLTSYGKHEGSSSLDLMSQAAELAIADAGLKRSEIEGRKVPTGWRVTIPAHGFAIETVPLNARSWMGTSFAYWEGPISFRGSHAGLGYLELTGY